MKWKNKGHEFDDLAGIILDAVETKSFYIWGAGYFGDAIFETLRNDVDFTGYIDTNPSKQGKQMNGMIIHSPEILGNIDIERTSILVSAGWTKEIFAELKHFGFVKNSTCFHIDEFLAIYMMYRHGKLYLSSCSLAITERCTLRCRKCAGFIPLLKNPVNFTLDEIAEDIEILFNSIEYLSSLHISGGDAICNPECGKILEYLASRYSQCKIGTINLMTNAIVVPNDRLCDILGRYNIYFRFTDYNLGKIQKIDQCIKKLEQYGIKYEHVKFSEWYDLGYPQESNGLVGTDELQRFHALCDIRSCSMIARGRFYLCGRTYSAGRIGYCDVDTSDYFDLNDFDPGRKIEFMEFALGFSEKGYYNYCKKCNGGFNVNRYKVTPGVQILKSTKPA
jgi:hypothetical protein